MPTTCSFDDLAPAERDLVSAALRARENAHAPYSGFSVGAALRAVDGTVHLGCNVEISSYGLTECAERVALFAARATGARDFDALAVAGPDSADRPTPPCGACRQVVWDLAGDIIVILASAAGEVQIWRAAELLPEPFGPMHLEEDRCP